MSETAEQRVERIARVIDALTKRYNIRSRCRTNGRDEWFVDDCELPAGVFVAGPFETNTEAELALASIFARAVDTSAPGQELRSRWNPIARWRHRRRQSEYDVLTSVATVQCTTGPINEGDHVTVYCAADSSWWVRKTEEFQDGRFERIDLTEGGL